MDNMINIDDYLRINLYDAVLVLISTLLIVLIVKKFFWNYVRQYLEQRQAFIQSQLDESKANLQESEKLKTQYEEKMANAKQEALDLISAAKNTASREAGEIVSKARDDAHAIKEKAEREIEHEKAKVREQLKEEISEVAFLAARKIVEKELDESTHKKYVEDFIDEAGEQTRCLNWRRKAAEKIALRKSCVSWRNCLRQMLI